VIPLDLAARYGTPSYVYDLAAIRRAHADLRRSLPDPSVLYYSVKANPHPLVVAQLARLGCRAEVSSVGEVDVAVESGFAPEHVLLTGPGKTAQTLGHALDRGVTHFSVDSPADLARLGELAADRDMLVDCLLRINADERVPGMALTMTGTASQFGADAAWVADRPELFRVSGGARVRGLHLYMGTNLDDENALMSQFEVAVRLADRLGARLGPFVEVDLGGGFGAPFAHDRDRPRFATLARRLTDLLDGHLTGWRAGGPRVAFESGRHLVADSGVLLCRVVDVKPSKDETFVVLDAGINQLGGMSGLRRVPRIVPDAFRVDAGDDGNRPAERMPVAAVVGPLCTPLDTFSRGVELPRLGIGDLVRIPNVGAYGLTASLLAFLGHPPAVEIVVDGDDVLSASRLELVRFQVGAPANLVDARSWT
jgi:diaminopimelate decarboxylase